MTFDPHKPTRTRDGRPATLRRIDGARSYPYNFEVPEHKGSGTLWIAVDREGRYIKGSYDSFLDLENYTPEPEPAPMPPKFDPTKPVQTRDGCAARIICTDLKLKNDPATIVALVKDRLSGEVPMTYRASGRWLHDREDGNDLINIPAEHTTWLVTYYNSLGFLEIDAYHDEKNARLCLKQRGERAVACVEVKYKEGDGLK
jgi:hypothetical protein